MNADEKLEEAEKAKERGTIFFQVKFGKIF